MGRLDVALVLLLLFPTLGFADFPGKIVKVYDGDTITVLNGLGVRSWVLGSVLGSGLAITHSTTLHLLR